LLNSSRIHLDVQSFSLLVTAQEGARNLPFYEYDRSRFLEKADSSRLLESVLLEASPALGEAA
jgi:hypothetical protein